MKSLLLVFTGLLLSSAAQAVGLHSDALKFECSGHLVVESVDRVGQFPGGTDRAGNQIPPYAYAYLNIGVESQNVECDLMEQKLEIDFKSKQLQSYVKLNLRSALSLQSQAELEVGQVYSFSAHQAFGFSDAEGYLPFFPLIHFESVSFLTEGIQLKNAYFRVNSKEVYDIYLNENEKQQLSELVFDYLELEDKKGLRMGWVVRQMLENHPVSRGNFYAFSAKVLELYAELEAVHEPKSYEIASVLTAVSSAIRNFSYLWNWQGVLNIPELVVQHPSLYNYKSTFVEGKQCLNMSAIQLESSLEILREKLQVDKLLANVKLNWKDPLKVIAGRLHSSKMTPCLNPITSTLSRETAKKLLDQYYN